LGVQNAANLTAPYAYLRSNTITISSITVFVCSYNYANTKVWTLTQVDPVSGLPTGLGSIDLTADPTAFSGHDQAILVIYPNKLDYGVYYLTYSVTIKYTMDYAGTIRTLYSQTYTHIQIVKAGLNVFGLKNGIMQQVYGVDQQIVLDPGSFSVDLDKFVDPSTLYYTFYCRKVPTGQSTALYFSGGGAITRLGALPNVYQVYSPTFSSNCFTSSICLIS
jgi:hypothetical protein